MVLCKMQTFGGSKQSNCQKLQLQILSAATLFFPLIFSCPYHFVFLSLYVPTIYLIYLFIYLSLDLCSGCLSFFPERKKTV